MSPTILRDQSGYRRWRATAAASLDGPARGVDDEPFTVLARIGARRLAAELTDRDSEAHDAA